MDIGKYKVTLDKVIAAALENFEAELKNSNIESLTTENKNELINKYITKSTEFINVTYKDDLHYSINKQNNLIRQSLYEYALKRNKEFDEIIKKFE
ncbi:MAG: hypothetical protein KA523_07060 [Flavobacterium sp.]|nr:hypothetical protein [Flavobacterium sp.]